LSTHLDKLQPHLGWKGLSGTNAITYYEKVQHTAIKSFKTLAQVVNVIKLFFNLQKRIYSCLKQSTIIVMSQLKIDEKFKLTYRQI
jgi:hypothetical protein